ncbi:MAG: superoxide dismutase [Deltaproteobacteria bacterium]|nr:superoxide dismutase [Deltaproteobacteria bacterium]
MGFAAAAAAPSGSKASAAFALPSLPWAKNALEPYIMARTIGFHYDKHHRAYVDNLNRLLEGKGAATGPIEKVIVESAGKADKTAIFNNAAQVWNHTFFWKSMKKGGGGLPKGALLDRIKATFGSFDKFKTAFVAAGAAQFGSGWVWLVEEGKTLKIVTTANADTPIAHGQKPLVTCDVWEHAYYLDYQNRRKDFLAAFLDHLVNWEFAAAQLE